MFIGGFKCGPMPQDKVKNSMRLFAEEVQTGARVLLRTAPVSDAQAVAGKFLAAWVFLAAVTLLTLPMPLQVMIQMYIVDIELSEATSFGFRYAFQTYISNHELDFQLKSVADEPNLALELGR